MRGNQHGARPVGGAVGVRGATSAYCLVEVLGARVLAYYCTRAIHRPRRRRARACEAYLRNGEKQPKITLLVYNYFTRFLINELPTHRSETS